MGQNYPDRKSRRRFPGLEEWYCCLVAVFPSPDAASKVVRNVEDNGFSKDEVLTVEEAELVQHEKEEKGLGNYLMQAAAIHRRRAAFHGPQSRIRAARRRFFVV